MSSTNVNENVKGRKGKSWKELFLYALYTGHDSLKLDGEQKLKLYLN